MEDKQLPLHVFHVDKLASAINRAHILIRSFFLSILLYHRLSLLLLLLSQNDAVSFTTTQPPPPLLPCLLLFLAEIILSLCWFFDQSFRWRPLHRAVFIDRLPEENKLPAVDVLICTADPDKEPTLEVMNTVVSAMALDYPADKLHVYLSDDGGAAVTLRAVKEAWGFATWWVPFCRKYGIKCRCPMTYFEEEAQDEVPDAMSESSSDFVGERLQLKEKYDMFKERVEKNLRQEIGQTDKNNKTDHPPFFQVINENCTGPSIINPNYTDIPLLVYIAREKRQSHPHHFKAGALNVLLRVSGILSNSPIVLVLDCDMYCNDPTSAKQAMCFYLDQEISSSLGFVQFPQRFRNISKTDLYDTGFRMAFKVLMQGMDGTNSGPMVCGTGFYMNRKALYDSYAKDLDPIELRKTFGPSHDYVKTLSQGINRNPTELREVSQEIQREAEFLASCSYEDGTKWGDGVGFFYYSVTEDVFTGYHLHCRGWKSVYLDPQRAAFLGTTTTNLNDVLTQNTRWSAGLVDIGLSRFCPLVYGPARTRLPLLQLMTYAWIDLYPLGFIAVWCLAVIPQLCLLHGIPLYFKVSSPLFPILAFTFLSSLLKHLQEVLTTGGTITSWWNEQTMWILKMLTCHTDGSIDAIMKGMGLKTTSFIPTNKFIDDEQAKRYHQGIHDFQTSDTFLVPLGTVVILNLVCLVGGLVRLVVSGNWDEMAAQVVFSGLLVVVSKPVVEGMVVRKDKGRVPAWAALMSVVVCLVILLLGPLILLH